MIGGYYLPNGLLFTNIIITTNIHYGNHYNSNMKWPCRWNGCERWAQSNGFVLCRAHFRDNEILLQQQIERGAEYRGAEALTHLRNDLNAAPSENDQPVDGRPYFRWDNRRRHHPQRPLLVVPNEEGGVEVRVEGIVEGNEHHPQEEVESENRVGNILAENANAEQHPPTSSSPPPSSSVPPPLTTMTTMAVAMAVAVAATAAHPTVDVHGELAVLGVHESELGQRCPARDEERVQEEIAQINLQLRSVTEQLRLKDESVTEQLRLKDERINELEDRIAEIERWRTNYFSNNWELCTSIGGSGFRSYESANQGTEQQEAATAEPDVPERETEQRDIQEDVHDLSNSDDDIQQQQCARKRGQILTLSLQSSI
jgi:hypothetical protein